MGKPKPEEPPPSKAYLVSFGDTMTALLAFFIVLLSLADDQSGMNLYTGTGSFVKATDGIGLPGAFSGNTSRKAVQQQAISPLYLADDLEEGEPDPKATGPDEDNGQRSIDREVEVFKRFLNEMDRMSKVKSLPETDGQVVFDIFNKFNKEAPWLRTPHIESIKRALPVLRKENYRVELIVWAAKPGELDWTRAIDKSIGIVNEVSAFARLDKTRRSRLVGLGKPWKYADVRRPVMSIVVRKLQ